MITFKTKSEAVFEKLRQKIFNGELNPGQRIVLSEIAKEFGTSEIPIREAIRKLESEGIVKVTPHVGAVVNLMEDSESLEVYLMRIELEVLATKLATPHITDADITRLNKIIQKAERAIETDNLKKLGPLNKEFHLTIYTVGSYQILYKTITDLWERFDLMQCVFSYAPERAIPSWQEHKDIVDALAQRNAKLAAKLVRQQKNQTKKAIEKVFKKSHKK